MTFAYHGAHSAPSVVAAWEQATAPLAASLADADPAARPRLAATIRAHLDAALWAQVRCGPRDPACRSAVARVRDAQRHAMAAAAAASRAANLDRLATRAEGACRVALVDPEPALLDKARRGLADVSNTARGLRADMAAASAAVLDPAGGFIDALCASAGGDMGAEADRVRAALRDVRQVRRELCDLSLEAEAAMLGAMAACMRQSGFRHADAYAALARHLVTGDAPAAETAATPALAR